MAIDELTPEQELELNELPWWASALVRNSIRELAERRVRLRMEMVADGRVPLKQPTLPQDAISTGGPRS